MTAPTMVQDDARTHTPIADRLAFLALVLAGGAAAIGLAVPGLYRDTAQMVREAQATDFVTLAVAVPALALGLTRARAGSASARMVSLGVIAYLAYSYAIYAFSVVINAMTPVHISILGLSVWSFVLTLRSFEAGRVGAASPACPPRRITAGFLLVVVALFTVLWLSQIARAITSGHLPATISDLGLPTNAVFALDLAFALPLLALVALWLTRRDRRGDAAAVAALSFTVLMGSSVLAIFAVDAKAGVSLDAAPILAFSTVTAGALALLAAGLRAGSSPSDLAAAPSSRRSTPQSRFPPENRPT